MTTLAGATVAQLLTKPHRDAEACDRQHVEAMTKTFGARDTPMAVLIAAFSLYLTVLRLLEPYLRPGAANGDIAQTLPIDEGRGAAFAVGVN